MNKRAVAILAAGKGTRMKSSLPKVLHKLGGKALVSHVIEKAKLLNPDKIVVIVGYRDDLVRESLSMAGVDFVYQGEQLGTGHAVDQTKPLLEGNFEEILILSGDVPNTRVETLQRLLDRHEETGSTISFISTELKNPTGYGRVVRDSNGKVVAIVEEKDADSKTKEIREINSGIYSFRGDLLFDALKHVDSNNEQGEYYLTDTIGWAISNQLHVEAINIEDSSEISGVNTRDDLLRLEEELSVANKNNS